NVIQNRIPIYWKGGCDLSPYHRAHRIGRMTSGTHIFNVSMVAGHDQRNAIEGQRLDNCSQKLIQLLQQSGSFFQCPPMSYPVCQKVLVQAEFVILTEIDQQPARLCRASQRNWMTILAESSIGKIHVKCPPFQQLGETPERSMARFTHRSRN